MADEGRLTKRQIVALGANIASDNMKSIAQGYLNLNAEVIRNIDIAKREDREGFNRDVLEAWKNKPKNSGPDQVKKLAYLLFKAADFNSYVDPVKVVEILQVSRHMLLDSIRDVPITVADLKDLAKNLRPIIEERTNISMVPWAKSHTVKMDNYTKLAIDKLENKPIGLQATPVEDYKELFPEGSAGSAQMGKGKRVLGKGDPGSGKTTFAKKVAWDWAKGIFRTFILVFFVSLKLVESGEPIENIIIRQTPELEDLGITNNKLRDILEGYGSHCLVILDGYDELISGNIQNDDIMQLINGQNFLYCNVILTSRPHCIAKFKQHFCTVINIQGFTPEHARKFASHFVKEEKIDSMMEIPCLNAARGKSVFTSPILLLFVCNLVKSHEIDLTRKNKTMGEIYMRLFRCLYRKYIVHKGKDFKQSEFVEILRKVGKVALEHLDPETGFTRRNQTIEELGEEIFEYGLLIGQEASGGLVEETTNMHVSFPDKTIQEFLAAFYFIYMFVQSLSST